MKKEAAIKVNRLSKDFKIPSEKHSTAKQRFVNIFKSYKAGKLKALDKISFEVKDGEFFGIIGANGSGKSTLLKILAQIYLPTTGNVEVKGKVSPFIELGVGFNPELTARENVFLNGAILGLSKEETEEKFDEMIRFAELEQFVDQKLKNFSSGMQVRLAFSIAIQAPAGILLVDEVLAVGDVSFQQKCFDVFRKLKEKGTTIVFVSHALNIVEEFSDRVALLNEGKLFAIGEPHSITNDYLELVADKEAVDFDKVGSGKGGKKRWGDGKAQIVDQWVESASGQRKPFYEEETIRIKMKVKFFADSLNPIFGIIIRNRQKIEEFGSNTKILNIKTGQFSKGEERIITWEFKNVLENGVHSISPAIAYSDALRFYDQTEDSIRFLVKKRYNTVGLINTKHKIEISG
jgi:ABC-type polysaccharide/polyol phosphate transport system ATPase subunit